MSIGRRWPSGIGRRLAEQPAGGILIDERASRSARDRRKGNLYSWSRSPARRPPGPAGAEIVELLHQTYYRRQGGVTAGLNRPSAKPMTCCLRRIAIPAG